MKDNCYIYFNEGLEIKDFGVNINTSSALSAKDKLDQIRNYISTISSNVVPLSNDMTLYNDFRVKNDDFIGLSQVYAYYFYQSIGLEGSFAIYRKGPNDATYSYICDLANSYGLLDYNIQSNDYYHYMVAYRLPNETEYTIYEYTNEDGDPVYFKTAWDFWSICNIEETNDEHIYQKTGDVWKLRFNMDNPQLTLNTSVTSWETLGRYSKYSVGQKNFTSSSISCLLGDMVQYKEQKSYHENNLTSGDVLTKEQIITGYTERMNTSSIYAREVEKYNAWLEFVSDGSLKLLKDYKGNSWIVHVQANPTATIDQTSNLMQTQISFQWEEVENIKDVAIISNEFKG